MRSHHAQHCLQSENKDGRRPMSASASCLSLIGMPGSGKSTLAAALADKTGWAYVDTDHLLEAWFGLPLEDLRQSLDRQDFLQAEERTLLTLDLGRCIIATGGSVIYCLQGMRALQRIGVIVSLQAEYACIEERVMQNPERGLVMKKGQTLGELYAERQALYEHYADLTLRTDTCSLQDCVQTLETMLYEIRSTNKQYPEDLSPSQRTLRQDGV